MGKTLEINELFKPLYTSNKRYFLVTGGRGSLKSTTVHDFISRLTFERGHGILFTRYTMSSAEKSIIPEFFISLERNDSKKYFSVTRDKIINTVTGSFILFSGIKTSSGDQTANLKSLAGITTWVIEEGEDFNDEKKFDDIDNSIRSNELHNRVIWIQNPTTPEHFIYQRFMKKNKKINIQGYDVTVSDDAEVEHIHTTYHIGLKYLSESFLQKAEQTRINNEKKYYHTYIGGWLDKAEGAILENWREGEFGTSLPYIYGQDYGFSSDPTTLIKFSIDKKKKLIYLDEILYDNGKLSTDNIYRLNKSLIANDNDLIIADSAEDRLISELKDRGLNILPCKKYPDSVRVGIAMLQDYTLIVTKESQNLKIELNNYVWNNKKAGVPIDKYNHLIDPIRYCMEEVSVADFYFG